VIQLKAVVDFGDDLIFFDSADGAFFQPDLIDFLFVDFDIETHKNELFSSLKGSKKAYQLSIADLLQLQFLVAVASLLVVVAYSVVA
jgi:hypothetical protein